MLGLCPDVAMLVVIWGAMKMHRIIPVFQVARILEGRDFLPLLGTYIPVRRPVWPDRSFYGYAKVLL